MASGPSATSRFAGASADRALSRLRASGGFRARAIARLFEGLFGGVTLDLMHQQSPAGAHVALALLEAPTHRVLGAATRTSWAALPQPRWRTSVPRCPPTTAVSRGSSVQGRGVHLDRKTRIQLSFNGLIDLSRTAAGPPRVTLLSSAVARTKLYWCGTFSNLLPRNSTKRLTNLPAPALVLVVSCAPPCTRSRLFRRAMVYRGLCHDEDFAFVGGRSAFRSGFDPGCQC